MARGSGRSPYILFATESDYFYRSFEFRVVPVLGIEKNLHLVWVGLIAVYQQQ